VVPVMPVSLQDSSKRGNGIRELNHCSYVQDHDGDLREQVGIMCQAHPATVVWNGNEMMLNGKGCVRLDMIDKIHEDGCD